MYWVIYDEQRSVTSELPRSFQLAAPSTNLSTDYCVPVASAVTRRHLHCANRQLLAVPRYCLNIYGRRTFSVAGPTVWNSPTISADCFRRLLKTYCLLDTSALSALEVLDDHCAI